MFFLRTPMCMSQSNESTSFLLNGHNSDAGSIVYADQCHILSLVCFAFRYFRSLLYIPRNLLYQDFCIILWAFETTSFLVLGRTVHYRSICIDTISSCVWCMVFLFLTKGIAFRISASTYHQKNTPMHC